MYAQAVVTENPRDQVFAKQSFVQRRNNHLLLVRARTECIRMQEKNQRKILNNTKNVAIPPKFSYTFVYSRSFVCRYVYFVSSSSKLQWSPANIITARTTNIYLIERPALKSMVAISGAIR